MTFQRVLIGLCATVLVTAFSVASAAPTKLCGRNIENLALMVHGDIAAYESDYRSCLFAMSHSGIPGFNYANSDAACHLAEVWRDDGTSRLCPTGPTKAEVRICLDPAARKSTQGADAACKRWGI